MTTKEQRAELLSYAHPSRRPTQALETENVGRPVLPAGANANKLAAQISSYYPVEATVERGNVLSVVLPPEIEVGPQAFDLNELILVLEGQELVKELGLGGKVAGCCGHHGCCIT